MCVADAANWGNIELAGTNPTYRPLPYRCEFHITSHSFKIYSSQAWSPALSSASPATEAFRQFFSAHQRSSVRIAHRIRALELTVRCTDGTAVSVTTFYRAMH